MNAILIEEVTTADEEVIDAMRRLLPQLSTSALAFNADQLREMISSRATTLLVARDRARGGEIVGTLCLALFRIPTGIRAWIENVVVDSASRGRGAGESLTRAAVKIASMRGASTIELTSRSSRAVANRLYQRLGFEQRDTNVYRLDCGPAPADDEKV
jgi:ribosomal protein S18 acetylase RimI-like enzyme